MFVRLSLIFLLISLEFLPVCLGQAPPATTSPEARPVTASTTNNAVAGAPLLGTISGIVTDSSGALLAGAQVELTRANEVQKLAARSGNDGRFTFPEIPAGAFQLTITSDGF